MLDENLPPGAGRSPRVMASRLINLADVVEVFRRAGGVGAAVAVARERSGTQFDPELVEVFCDRVPMNRKTLRGGGRNRTTVRGFAGPCKVNRTAAKSIEHPV